MDLNILVLNLVILIYVIGIKGKQPHPRWRDEKPRWSNGQPIYNNTSSQDFDGDYDEEVIANLKDIKQTLQNTNRKTDAKLRAYKNDTFQMETKMFDIRFDTLPSHCKKNETPHNCAEATSCTHQSGIYRITQKNFSSKPFLVECDVKTHGGDWTLIQRRHDGSVDFERLWSDYANGFGDIQGEFFIGLNKLHAMTNYNGPQELLIIMQDKNGTGYAKYNNFVVGNEHDYYTLHHVGSYSGNAGDSFTFQLKQKFNTKDVNYSKDQNHNCAIRFTGAWWYRSDHQTYQFCHRSNLNGKYGDNNRGNGINWYTFRGYFHSLDYVAMMIRRRTF